MPDAELSPTTVRSDRLNCFLIICYFLNTALDIRQRQVKAAFNFKAADTDFIVCNGNCHWNILSADTSKLNNDNVMKRVG